LGGLDYVLPTEETAITSDMTLQVIRITEDIVSAREPIPYETTYQSDETLELDQRAVVQAGQTGVRRVDERVRYANGEEIGREPAGSVVEEAPINEIVAYGTRIVLRDVQTPEGTRQYWRKFQAYATSYHPAALGGDNVTSIGETLVTGIVAANPNIIPYRTDVFVQGYGVGMMADTGGARSSPYWIDLGYSDEDWVSWSRYVDVYLLAPVPENINYLLPAWTPIRGQQP
jgi:3D (Asp-Asp-Asp) domain-containing protein